MTPSKKSRSIKVFAWIAALSILQVMIDKVLFDLPSEMTDRDIEFYQPRSQLEANLREMNLYIHDKDLISKLSISTGEKTVNDEYIEVLVKYHNQILELYNILRSRDIALSLEKMTTNIARSLDYTGSESCLMVGESKDSYTQLINDFPDLMARLDSRPDNILELHKRIRSISPLNGDNIDAVANAYIERVNIIRDLLQDPYLAVRKGNTESLQEINQFFGYFDLLHTINSQCVESHNQKLKTQEKIKEAISFICFILLTIALYRKEMLGIQK